MKKILLFLVLVLCGCTSLTKKISTSGSVSCQQEFATRALLQSEVLDAINHADEQKLIRLGACQFMVGPPNSDNAGFVEPRYMMPIFLRAVDFLKWAQKGADYGEQYNLPSVDSKFTHELIFKKEKGLWFWAGYTTSDDTIVHRLLTEKENVK